MRVVSKRWCWWIYHKIGEINKPDSRKSCFHHSVVNFGSISFLQKKRISIPQASCLIVVTCQLHMTRFSGAVVWLKVMKTLISVLNTNLAEINLPLFNKQFPTCILTFKTIAKSFVI